MEATARWRHGIDLVHIDWPYADELRLAIDAEYGVLLKFETVLDGAPFIRWQAGEIAFNEALPGRYPWRRFPARDYRSCHETRHHRRTCSACWRSFARWATRRPVSPARLETLSVRAAGVVAGT